MSGADRFLDSILIFAESNIRVGVTIVISGAIVTGTVISGKEYFESLARSIASATIQGDTDTLRMMSDIWGGFSREYERPDGVEGWTPPFDYIYLREARYYAPGQTPLPDTGDGMLWRGKVADVSGVSVGDFALARS